VTKGGPINAPLCHLILISQSAEGTPISGGPKNGEQPIALAEYLNIPLATWLNYEQGVAMPADIMLEFLEVTGANPRWLLSGDGQSRYVNTA